jgi:N-methylhydantoinase B
MNTPVEAIEQRFPIRIERYELVPNSGGAGKFRGSLALRRDIRVLTGPVSFARYVQADDLIRLTLPGAGGYGDPKERSLDALDRDLMDGKVTPDAAEAHYAIIVDRAVPCKERYATQCLRAKMAAARD